MWSFWDLVQNFFTHKDFLPSADQIPGTLFTPLHFIFSAVFLTVVLAGAYFCSRLDFKKIRIIYLFIWLVLIIWEPTKIIWESVSGKMIGVEFTGLLPLYPCSVFLYTMPLVIWGNKTLRYMGCGYVCSLGFLGGAINFVYPANILCAYSCISFAGFHTFAYHGALVFTAVTLLASGQHSYKGITKTRQLFLPAVPFLIISIIANLVNFSPINSDYMFFKLESFIFAPIGAILPHFVAVILVYASYLLIHALPYLPSYITNRRKSVIV